MSCDRCHDPKPFAAFLLGRRLCGSCVRAFERWVEVGVCPPVRSGGRAAPGKRQEQAERLIAVHGYVTSVMLADATGQHRTAANWYLHARAKAGALVFQGNGWFVLPKAKEAVG